MLMRTLILFALFLTLPFGMANYAHARVDILPRKIVLEPRDRSAEITVLNLYDEPSLYRISFLNYRQNPDGSYTTLEQPLSELFDPEEVVRLSPRQFTVQPRGRQKIRISLRKPEALPEGEYRFHILAQRREMEDTSRPNEQNSEGVSVTMQMNVGVAIPVVVRHGQTQVQAQINEMRYIPPSQTERQRPELFVSVNREGNASSIGILSIFAGEERIGYISNFNIFTEIDQRSVAVPLSREPIRGSDLRIVYETDDGEIFDEKTFQP